MPFNRTLNRGSCNISHPWKSVVDIMGLKLEISAGMIDQLQSEICTYGCTLALCFTAIACRPHSLLFSWVSKALDVSLCSQILWKELWERPSKSREACESLPTYQKNENSVHRFREQSPGHMLLATPEIQVFKYFSKIASS